MAKKSTKKKVVVTSKKQPTTARRVSPTVAKSKTADTTTRREEALLFDRQSYIWMGVGLALIALGLLLMSGGSMPDSNIWDPDIIYSFRRISLAPILILAGLVIEIYAIFKR